ncbi:MAG TPA: hypothetical protein VHN15_06235, partial [Thermoanaerobaculia bacterium]|nr:hypothetical protein [Thermoanaerobaculia bacterium]
KRRGMPEAPPVPILVPTSNGPGGFAPYLEKLDRTLAVLADASASPRGGAVVQSLAPGVHDLLSEMVDAVGETLIPLLRGIGRRLKAEVKADPQWNELLDKTFKNLDQLRDLAEALRKIDVRRASLDIGGQHPAGPPLT